MRQSVSTIVWFVSFIPMPVNHIDGSECGYMHMVIVGDNPCVCQFLVSSASSGDILMFHAYPMRNCDSKGGCCVTSCRPLFLPTLEATVCYCLFI